MRLQSRDYLQGLTDEEEKQYNKVLEEERLGFPKFGRKNLFYKYPKAARHLLSLFPNNYLDINELKERFGHHSAYLFPEFQLGASMRPDYLLIGESSGGFEFVFVELESVYGRITLQDGNLGDSFNKGIRQVNDWSRWLQANYNHLYTIFLDCKSMNEQLSQEFIQYDESRIHYVVIAGRRSNFNELTYRIGREFESKQKIKLLHYDNLLDYSNNIIGENSY